MAKIPVIDIRPCDLETVREILRRHVPNHEVLAFGSRVKWTARQYSDLDLAIRSDEAIPTNIIYAIKNELSESRLPMMVDVLDMASVSETFRGIIEEEYAVVQEKNARGNWKEVRLAEVADISTGKSNRVDATEDGEYAFFDRSKEVRKSSRYLFDCEAVIVPGEGKEFIPRYFSGKFDLHQRAYAITNFRGVCGRFVYYAMGAQRKYFERVAVGSTVKSLRLKMFQDFPLELPPLAEQKKIARILGALDDKIELNRRMNKTLGAMAQAIFKSWFIDFDPVHAKSKGLDTGLPPALAALFPAQFEDSESGKIPRGWGIGTVADLCDRIESGGTPRRQTSSYWENGSIPWFKTGELADSPLLKSRERITDDGLKNSACKMWQPGTILIALYAAPTVGRMGILEIPATANQACSALSAKPQYGGQFLFYTLLFARDALQQIAVGSAQQNINQQILREHPVLLPAENMAPAFQKSVDALYRKRAGMSAEIENLSAMRDALLPHLLSGRAQSVSAS